MPEKPTRWEGGYIRYDRRGRPTYYLERKVNGRRFHVCTRAHTARAALWHLARFEGDPLAYRPEGGQEDRDEEPIRLTAELAHSFLRWSEAKGNTGKWVREQENRLANWIEDLAGVDLRQATLRDHIVPALERRGTSRQHRVIVLKAFFAWLRKEKHLLRSHEDPTLDLPVPQGKPEKWRRRKAVDVDVVRAAAAHLVGPYRDLLLVLAATGWHTTELERFVRRTEGSEINYPRKGLAVLSVKHKIGESHRTTVKDEEVIRAAERLRARGRVPRRLNTTIKAACKAAGVPPFTSGVLRHSVATWATERGEHPAVVSQFLGHKDPRTTRRFYADVAVPKAVKLPRIGPGK